MNQLRHCGIIPQSRNGMIVTIDLNQYLFVLVRTCSRCSHLEKSEHREH